MLRLKRTAQPTFEPLSVAEAMAHCRIDTNADDTYVEGLISVAREWCEDSTATCIVTSTWALSMDDWPTTTLSGVDANRIVLPRPPLQSVSSIQYVDTDGTTQTLSTDVYAVDTSSPYQSRVTLKYAQAWPSIRSVANAITITYVAGYTSAANVPPRIKHAMKLLIGHWYENRETSLVGTISKELEFTVGALLGLGDLTTVG